MPSNSGLVSLPEIATIPLVRETMQRVHEQQGTLTGPLMRKAIVHMLIDVQVSDVLQQAGVVLARNSFVQRRRGQAANLRFGPSPSLQHKKQELEAFLYSHVYRHPKLIAMRELAQNRLQAVVSRSLRGTALPARAIPPPRGGGRTRTQRW